MSSAKSPRAGFSAKNQKTGPKKRMPKLRKRSPKLMVTDGKSQSGESTISTDTSSSEGSDDYVDPSWQCDTWEMRALAAEAQKKRANSSGALIASAGNADLYRDSRPQCPEGQGCSRLRDETHALRFRHTPSLSPSESESLLSSAATEESLLDEVLAEGERGDASARPLWLRSSQSSEALLRTKEGLKRGASTKKKKKKKGGSKKKERHEALKPDGQGRPTDAAAVGDAYIRRQSRLARRSACIGVSETVSADSAAISSLIRKSSQEYARRGASPTPPSNRSPHLSPRDRALSPVRTPPQRPTSASLSMQIAISAAMSSLQEELLESMTQKLDEMRREILEQFHSELAEFRAELLQELRSRKDPPAE